jgi:hypothetical protein
LGWYWLLGVVFAAGVDTGCLGWYSAVWGGIGCLGWYWRLGFHSLFGTVLAGLDGFHKCKYHPKPSTPHTPIYKQMHQHKSICEGLQNSQVHRLAIPLQTANTTRNRKCKTKTMPPPHQPKSTTPTTHMLQGWLRKPVEVSDGSHCQKAKQKRTYRQLISVPPSCMPARGLANKSERTMHCSDFAGAPGRRST